MNGYYDAQDQRHSFKFGGLVNLRLDKVTEYQQSTTFSIIDTARLMKLSIEGFVMLAPYLLGSSDNCIPANVLVASSCLYCVFSNMYLAAAAT